MGYSTLQRVTKLYSSTDNSNNNNVDVCCPVLFTTNRTLGSCGEKKKEKRNKDKKK